MKPKQIIFLIAAVVVAVAVSFIPGLEYTTSTGATAHLTPQAMQFVGIFLGFLICMVGGVAADHIVVIGALAVLLLVGFISKPELVTNAEGIQSAVGVGTMGQAMFTPGTVVEGVAKPATAIAAGTVFQNTMGTFANTTTWLVIAGFGLSAALAKCGLLKRIALFILQFFPASYTGQILAMLTTGTVLSPLLPSVNAKAVLMAPLANEVSKSAGFAKSSQGAGGLFAASYMSAGLFGNAFLTGSLYVALMLGFVPAAEKGNWDFLNILSVTWVWFIIVVVLSFFAIMFLYKPKEKMEFEKGYAKKQLAEMGKISRDELVCALFLLLAIVFWVDPFGLKLDATVIGLAAFVGICVFGGNAFTAADFGPRIPWTIVMLIGGIQALANMLTAHKISDFLSATIGPVVSFAVGNAFILVPVIVIITYLLRFVVISQIATGTIMFAIFSGLVTGNWSFFILGFVIYASTQIWTLPFNNTAEIAARGATNGEMVEHKDTVRMSYAYMIINFVALLASVPLWMALGYIG